MARLHRLFLLLALCAGINHQVIGQQDPDLVVVLVVDQMRYDFIDRFDQYFEGGFRRLIDEGVVYTNAHQDFMPTNTGPGHATIFTGKYPNQSGIVNNSFYDKQVHKEVYCVEDLKATIIGVDNNGALPGRSPRNLTTTTFGDWFKKKTKESRVFSVSRKDRAAVIMGGQRPDGVYWLDNLSGQMISSSYYMKEVPSWVSEFSGKDKMEDVFESGWTKFASEEVYSTLRPDNFIYESGLFVPDFPHTLERMSRGIPESQRKAQMMVATPMSDRLILDFAKRLVEEEAIGTRGASDMLMLSCSAADAVGHHFGPLSHEVMDHFLYLDKYLGDFFNFLDTRLGKENYWVVLSSDHGVIPMPEAMKQDGVEGAQRIPNQFFVTNMDSIQSRTKAKFGLESPVIESLLGGLYINFLEIDAIGVDRKEVLNFVAQQCRDLDFIEDAFTSDEISRNVDRPYIDLVRRGYVNGRSPDILLIERENVLIHTQTGTTHGSVHEYDTHVPVIFMIPGYEGQRVDRKVSTVDIAPTLASLLELKADKKVDGTILKEFD